MGTAASSCFSCGMRLMTFAWSVSVWRQTCPHGASFGGPSHLKRSCSASISSGASRCYSRLSASSGPFSLRPISDSVIFDVPHSVFYLSLCLFQPPFFFGTVYRTMTAGCGFRLFCPLCSWTWKSALGYHPCGCCRGSFFGLICSEPSEALMHLRHSSVASQQTISSFASHFLKIWTGLIDSGLMLSSALRGCDFWSLFLSSKRSWRKTSAKTRRSWSHLRTPPFSALVPAALHTSVPTRSWELAPGIL